MGEFGTAVILAGGRSSRMRFDKQLLYKGEQSLIKRICSSLRARFDDIVIVSNTPGLYAAEGVRVVSDLFPGLGPLAGIHAGLTHAESQWVFVTACDMPFVDLPYIDYMMSRIKGTEYEACVTDYYSDKSARYQAFHAFYSLKSLPVMEGDLEAQKASIAYFLRKIDTLVIPPDLARRYITVSNPFLNLNTRSDYERFLFGEEG